MRCTREQANRPDLYASESKNVGLARYPGLNQCSESSQLHLKEGMYFFANMQNEAVLPRTNSYCFIFIPLSWRYKQRRTVPSLMQ